MWMGMSLMMRWNIVHSSYGKWLVWDFVIVAMHPLKMQKKALPSDLEPPYSEQLNKTVIIFHDESTFQANDDQPTLWAEKGTSVMRPKSKGSGIMVSDFIEEKNGYVALSEEEYDKCKLSDKNAKMYERQLFEYWESKEGYWTSERFMSQIKEAVKIANFKYLKSEGWRVVWVFDHSSCHVAMAEHSLDMSHINVKPGRKQRVMRDGWWGGKPQKMVTAAGVSKGMKMVLEERGVNTSRMNADKMREVLGSHPDFKYEKSKIERYLTEECGHIMYMLPKFHCELNTIERVWAQSKRYTKAYCKYNKACEITLFLLLTVWLLKIFKITLEKLDTTCLHTWRVSQEGLIWRSWSKTTKKNTLNPTTEFLSNNNYTVFWSFCYFVEFVDL